MNEAISIAETGGVRVVTLQAHEITEEIAKALREEFPPDAIRPEKTVILDLSRLGFLGTTGISVLLRLLKHVKLSGGRLAIVGLKGACLDVLKVTNLIRVFDLYPDVKAAREGREGSRAPFSTTGGATPLA